MKIDYEKYLNKDRFYTQSQIKKLFPYKSPFLVHSLVLKNIEDYKRYALDDNMISLNSHNSAFISEKLLIDLLSDNGMWNYLRYNYINDYHIAFSIAFIDSNNDIQSMTVNKSQLAYALEQIQDKIDNKERLNHICGRSSIGFLEWLYSDKNTDELFKEMKKHSCIIDGVEETVDCSELLSILLSDDDHFNDFIKGNYISINKVEVLTYMLVDFCEKNRLFQKYNFPPNIIKRYQGLKHYKYVDYESVNKFNKSGLENAQGVSIINEYSIDNELKLLLHPKERDCYSSLETAIYAYIKLCDVLSFDVDYYLNDQTEKEDSIRSALYNVAFIDEYNNKVNSTEFMLIFAKVLNELGIKFNIDFGNQSNMSPHISFASGEYIVDVDLFSNAIRNDMTQVKMGGRLSSIKILNKNEITVAKFKETLHTIYLNYVIDNNKKKESEQYVRSYKNLSNLGIQYPVEKKIKLLLSLIQESNLTGMDLINYVQEVMHRTIEKEQPLSYKIYLYTNRETNTIRLFLNIIENNNNYLIDLNGNKMASKVDNNAIQEMEQNENFRVLLDYTYEDIKTNNYRL